MACKEWIPGSYNQMRAFQKRSGQDFLLTALEHPNVKVPLSGLRQSAGDGSFQAYGAHILGEDKAKLVSEVVYSIHPVNTSEVYQWVVAPGVSFSP